MGVIRRQGMKQSVVGFVGVGIGAINTLFVYPYCLSKTEFGLIMFLLSVTMLLVPFVYMGTNLLTVRYFPAFRDPDTGHRGMLTLLSTLLAVGLLLLTVVALLFKPIIYGWYAPLEQQYLPWVLPLVALIAYANLLAQYGSNFLRIVIPSLFNELLVKLVLPALVGAYFFGWLPFDWIIYGLVVMYAFALLGNLWYLHTLGELRYGNPWRFLREQVALRQEMSVYAGYGIVGSVSDRLATQLDLTMVTSIIDPAAAAVYRIGSLVGNVVEIPRKSMFRIIGPILSDRMDRGDRMEVLKLYQKSSLTLLLAGLLVFGGIWVNVDSLFAIMPNGEEYRAARFVILLLGITNLVNMVTSINDSIIGFSKYFRWRFYFILLLGFLNIAFNYYLIPRYAIYGAAMATLFTVTLYNFGKTLLIWVKMDLHPFTRETGFAVLIGAVAYLVAAYLPLPDMVWLELVVRSFLFASLFGGMVLAARLSPEVNQLPMIWWKKWRENRRP